MKIYFEAKISDRLDKFYITSRFRSLDAAMKFWTSKFPDALEYEVTNDPDSGTALMCNRNYWIIDNPFPLAECPFPLYSEVN